MQIIPEYKCLLQLTRLRASIQIKQRQDWAAQLVARMLFMYKAEYLNPGEYIALL
jgi:hypothetical protein